MKHKFKKRRKSVDQSLTSYPLCRVRNCLQRAVSACNYSSENFEGCGKTFCQCHGTPHYLSRNLSHGTLFRDDLVAMRKSHSLLVRGFPEREFQARACQDCLPQLTLQRTEDKPLILKFSIAALAILFVIILGRAIFPSQKLSDYEIGVIKAANCGGEC